MYLYAQICGQNISALGLYVQTYVASIFRCDKHNAWLCSLEHFNTVHSTNVIDHVASSTLHTDGLSITMLVIIYRVLITPFNHPMFYYD
jgi:hypothetical protein